MFLKHFAYPLPMDEHLGCTSLLSVVNGAGMNIRVQVSVGVPTGNSFGKGHPGGEQYCKGTQENCATMWFAVSGFMVMVLVSGWSLANHSNSESFLVAHASLSQDGC